MTAASRPRARISRARRSRQHAFAHHRAPQRADAGQGEQPGAAQEIHRQEGGEERPVQAVDRRRPQAHVEVAAALIALRAPPARRCPRRRARASTTASRSAATSRRPRLSPCAPIGGKTCAASPTRARRSRLVALDREPAHRHEPARAVDPHRAEDRLRLPLDRQRQRRVVERHRAARPRSAVRHPDQARAAAGEGNEGERPVAGVELGRGRRHGRGHGRGSSVSADLRIGPGPGADAARLAQARVAAVRRDDEARAQRSNRRRGAGAERSASSRRVGRVALDQTEAWRCRRRLGQALDQHGVLDVPAEGLEADLARLEGGRRRAEQAAAVVDEPHRRERRRALARARPRRRAPRGSARSRRAARPCARPAAPRAADQAGPETVAREGERRREPGGAAPTTATSKIR